MFKPKIRNEKKNIRNKFFLSNIRKIQLFSKRLLSKYNPSKIAPFVPELLSETGQLEEESNYK